MGGGGGGKGELYMETRMFLCLHVYMKAQKHACFHVFSPFRIIMVKVYCSNYCNACNNYMLFRVC